MQTMEVKPPRAAAPGAGGNGFFGGLAGFTEVDVDIDQAGQTTSQWRRAFRNWPGSGWLSLAQPQRSYPPSPARQPEHQSC